MDEELRMFARVRMTGPDTAIASVHVDLAGLGGVTIDHIAVEERDGRARAALPSSRAEGGGRPDVTLHGKIRAAVNDAILAEYRRVKAARAGKWPGR